jgi:hypothetical protein
MATGTCHYSKFVAVEKIGGQFPHSLEEINNDFLSRLLGRVVVDHEQVCIMVNLFVVGDFMVCHVFFGILAFC